MARELPPALVEELSITPNDREPELDDGTRTRVRASGANRDYPQRIELKMVATDEFARKLVAFFNEQQVGEHGSPYARATRFLRF